MCGVQHMCMLLLILAVDHFLSQTVILTHKYLFFTCISKKSYFFSPQALKIWQCRTLILLHQQDSFPLQLRQTSLCLLTKDALGGSLHCVLRVVLPRCDRSPCPAFTLQTGVQSSFRTHTLHTTMSARISCCIVSSESERTLKMDMDGQTNCLPASLPQEH